MRVKTKDMSVKTVFFRPRFLASIDAKLRAQISRRGELVQLVILILTEVDLSTIPLLEISSDIQDLAETTVKLPATLHAHMKRIAATRNVSMNALVNSAVSFYDAKKQKKVSAKKNRP
jgi:hypothetical protein